MAPEELPDGPPPRLPSPGEPAQCAQTRDTANSQRKSKRTREVGEPGARRLSEVIGIKGLDLGGAQCAVVDAKVVEPSVQVGIACERPS